MINNQIEVNFSLYKPNLNNTEKKKKFRESFNKT